MTALRLAGLGAGAMAVQWWWSSEFLVMGLSPQLLLVLTVAVSARLGPIAAMSYGFVWGLFLDVLRPQLFGANALALVLVGYGTGSVRRQIDVGGLAPQVSMVFLMTWAYFILFGLLGLVFLKSFLWVGWKAFFLNPLYNCLIVPAVFLAGEQGASRR